MTEILVLVVVFFFAALVVAVAMMSRERRERRQPFTAVATRETCVNCGGYRNGATAEIRSGLVCLAGNCGEQRRDRDDGDEERPRRRLRETGQEALPPCCPVTPPPVPAALANPPTPSERKDKLPTPVGGGKVMPLT